MSKKILVALLFLTFPTLARAETHWVLKKSTLTYHVVHPLHRAEGVSHAARGKGVCRAGTCNFLIAAPVKSFNSGDSDRDLHMLEVTRGAEFPMVIVRIRLPKKELHSSTINANLHIWFGGHDVTYNNVPLKRAMKGKDMQVTGTIPLKLSDFKISRPELLAMPIKNEVPITVNTTWAVQ